MTPLPLTRDLVLIGGGHAHALVLRMWGMAPLAGVRLTLINPDPVAPYTGMLPGCIAGHYPRDAMMIDLVRLARCAGARLILGRAEGIDRTARQVIVSGRAPVAYDVASLDIGITSDLPDLPGFAAHGLAAKPLGAFVAAWERFLAAGTIDPKVVVLGGGVGGVELALATAHRLQVAGRRPCVTVLERADRALDGVGAGARAALLGHVDRLGVQLLTRTAAARVTAQGVETVAGTQIPADLVLGVAGARPQGWLRDTGLVLANGFIAVGPTLQSSDPAVFGAGDCVQMTHAPRPRAGVFAVRQAPVLLHNLRAALSRGHMRRYHPQRDYLKLISTGGKGAVADKWGLRLDGAVLWRWKDRIDRRFMAKFGPCPAMAAPGLPAEHAAGLAGALDAKPLCGGCGAKVAAGELAAALSHLPAPVRADVLSGPGDDAAVLRRDGGVQVMTTDHVRAFTEDPWLLARITAIHALGDIWAMGARPQVALAQVTLPRLAPHMQAATLREIMQAASGVFSAAGADIVGGHTAIGAELTLGFTVTGLAGRVVTKGGARPGDALILTKAIGTGTLLAAEMAAALLPGGLLGEAVAAAYAQMCRPMDAASTLLAPVAHAMTDVTGFGLAGHLLELLQASGCAARLDLARVPLLAGAEALAAAGHASSLAPANRAAAAPRMHFAESPRAALLFDPQTAGGLLAAVPPEHAETLVAALLGQGEAGAVIGRIEAGAPRLTVVWRGGAD
ncbi:MAG: selenide, water dikinase SelD [Rhodobacter sp.]|nr:selenide, water dikinase SelD [Rhodobacter sp.]